MTRFALLLPLSLGLLVACDGAGPTSPDSEAVIALSVLEDAENAIFDVQPLGWLDSAVINVATGKPLTIAVLDYAEFFDHVDLASIRFFGDAAPVHLDKLLADLGDCHEQSVAIMDIGDDGLPYVVETVAAAVLHFELDLSGYADGTIVNMCLTGSFVDDDGNVVGSFPADWCADVTVKNRGGGPAR